MAESVIATEPQSPTSGSADAPPVVEHSLYDLFLNGQDHSPTRWLIRNAEEMPVRLLALLQSRQHTIPRGPGRTLDGWLFPGVAGEEVVRVTKVEWERPANLITALDEETNLSRPLRLTFEITQVDGKVQELARVIPNLPFPTPWGTYVTGANQEILANKLVQKPGIFPVNLQEAGKLDPENNGILWHTTTASVLQTEKVLVAIVRSLTNALRNDGGRNKPVIIPRRAWAELDAALNEARSHQQPLDLAKYPQLVSAFKEAHKIDDRTRLDFPLSSWVRELANARIPDGSWQKRLNRLEAADLAAGRTWSLANSEAADSLRRRLPQDEFITFSSLARLRVQTGADILAEMLAQLIAARINEISVSPERRNQPARMALSGLWSSTNWRVTEDLIAATHAGTDRQMKTLANEKTPAETAMRINSLIREGHLFATTDGSDETRSLSAKQRETHFPSSQFYLSAVTMENTSVGNVLHMLPRTRVRPGTGELEAPIVINDASGQPRQVWLNNEELEILQSDLAARGLGIAFGRPPAPDPSSRRQLVNLHRDSRVVARVPVSDVPAYFDAAPEDVLPLGLRMLPDNARVEVARHFIALAFVNGASSCYGSEPDRDYSSDAAEACAQLLNTGKFIKSPVDGTIETVERQGRIGAVTILTDDAQRHRISYPIDLSNAFSNATGLTCLKRPGERVSANEPLVLPDQACVINSAKLGTPGVFPSVPLRAAEFSIGEEDLLVLSAGVKASGKLTVLKQGNTAAINGANGPIRLAVARPGTMILPGMLLAWQQVLNADGTRGWREIRAGEGDRGVLANVFVVPDRSGQGAPVEIAPQAATQRPSLARQVQELLVGVVSDFAEIADKWTPEIKEYWGKRGHDVTAPYESANVWLWSTPQQKWEAHQITFAGIRAGRGSPDYDLLCAALQRPKEEVVFGAIGDDQRVNRNFLETRLNYTHEFAARVAERINMPLVDDMPVQAKRVAFSLLRELPVADGDKGAALGTKGSVSIVHPQHLPMTLVNGQVLSPEIAYSVLGFFARSSWGDMEAATKGQHAATLNSVVYDPNRGSVEVPVRYGTYRFLRQAESNPDTAASSRGMPNRVIDLGSKAAGFSSNFMAQDGRKGNRADHTLMPDARPALEVSYAGNRDSSVFRDHIGRIREELASELPMVSEVEPVTPATSAPPPTARPDTQPSPVGPEMI